ncbi:hypothetical protein F4810DRAFT_505617 [Camillea tinctor]|nr:hypothetical protein F4810DRAFT_505617 [Camillea tinctor]
MLTLTQQDQLNPWLTQTSNVAHNQTPKDTPVPDKNVEWYQPEIESLPTATVEFFEKYVGIKGEKAIKAHIYHIRDKAWNILPYPCIGLFRFLDFSIHLSPDYPEVVRRVQGGATFLDLGCCFGQDIRKLAYDAGTSENLIGCDLEESFLQLGYELFVDSATLKSTFVPGNVFAEDFLEQYHGKIDIIYLASFLHLFTEGQQKTVIGQIKKLLRPQSGSMVFGRHLGAEKGGPFKMESIGWDLYRHDQQTISDLFQVSGDEWKVTSSLSRYGSANWNDDRRGWQGGETKQMMFTAVRL